MGEISADVGSKKKGKKARSKKMSTKVDFTPMVDLAFLLITFFMLTTTLSKPKTMHIGMPEKADVPDPTKFAESSTITIILSENDRIYYYFGIKDPKVEVTDFSSDGIRKVLIEKNEPQIVKVNALREKLKLRKITKKKYEEEVIKVTRQKDALKAIIKADDNAKYANLVDILDEMLITSVGSYAIVDISQQELKLIAELK